MIFAISGVLAGGGLSLSALQAGEPANAPPAHSRIFGLSHVAVKATNFEQSVAFYRDFLGFAEQGRLFYPTNGRRELVYLKVSDTQTIEVFDAANVTQVAGQLYQVALHVEDAEAMRAQLARHGSRVPPVVGRGQMKNANFTTRDPEGTIIEVVQYLPEGRMVLDRGKFLPATRISDHLLCAVLTTTRQPEMLRFYRDALGFSPGERNAAREKEPAYLRLQIPGSTDYVDLMLGAVEERPYFGFEVRDVDQARARLERTSYWPTYGHPLEARRGKDGRRVLEVFDPDGMRIELIEARQPKADSP